MPLQSDKRRESGSLSQTLRLPESLKQAITLCLTAENPCWRTHENDRTTSLGLVKCVSFFERICRV